jgi:hypothetical protein
VGWRTLRLTLGYLLVSYRRWSSLIALGSANLGTALVVASLGVIALATWRARRRHVSDPVLIARWLGVAVLLVWAAAFLNHTAVHPYFMARLLVIPVIGAAVLLMGRLFATAVTGSHGDVMRPALASPQAGSYARPELPEPRA